MELDSLKLHHPPELQTNLLSSVQLSTTMAQYHSWHPPTFSSSATLPSHLVLVNCSSFTNSHSQPTAALSLLSQLLKPLLPSPQQLRFRLFAHLSHHPRHSTFCRCISTQKTPMPSEKSSCLWTGQRTRHLSLNGQSKSRDSGQTHAH